MKLWKGVLCSTSTLVGLTSVLALGVLSSVVGNRTAIRYERVGFVAVLQEINSWLVSARIAYPKVYFGLVGLIVALFAMAIYTRIAKGSARDADRLEGGDGRGG